MNLRYLLNSGKNNKIRYYLTSHLRYLIPKFIYRNSLNKWLSYFETLPDSERCYILDRVNYYCKLADTTSDAELQKRLPSDAKQLKDHTKKSRKGYSSPYFFDTYEYTRYFSPALRWNPLFGDINYIPEFPSILKSRPIDGDNENSVILKLNKNRHFIRVKDNIKFEQKSNKAIFRGDIMGKPVRLAFVREYINHPLCDIGVVSRRPNSPKELEREALSIYDHLKCKFVFALEGYDVASNLKWVMSSNSLAVMPKPTCETWFMEGRLEAGVHYVEIAPDFSDLEERLQYYIDHPAEAETISRNANRYVEQFWNSKHEDLISIMTYQRYFEMTGQLISSASMQKGIDKPSAPKL